MDDSGVLIRTNRSLRLAANETQRLTLCSSAARHLCGAGLSLLLCLAAASSAWAQPQIGTLDPRALTLGASQRIVITGSGFDDQTRVVSELEVTQSIVKAEPGRLELDVTAQGSSGIYPIWLVNANGVSAATMVSVDAIPTLPMSESVAALPVALAGDLRGNKIERFEFPAAANQRVAIEVEARRFGGGLNPVVRVLDHSGRQLAAASPDRTLAGDARTEFIAPADGRYFVELQDQLRRGANPGFYRIKVGDFQFADIVLPTVIGVGATDRAAVVVAPISHLVSSDAQNNAQPVAAMLPDPDGSATWRPAQVVAPLTSGSNPVVRVVPWNVAIEERVDPSTRAVQAPVSISGSLNPEATSDSYTVTLPHAGRWTIDVWSTRLGQPGDPVLDVATVAGAGLGRSDDAAGSKDPKLEVTVGEDQKEIRVTLSDLLHRTSDQPYLIEVLPSDQPQVTGRLEQDSISVGPNGAIVAVPIDRVNHTGLAQLSLEMPIPGISLVSSSSTGVSDRALIRLQAESPMSVGVSRIKVTAMGANGETSSSFATRVADVTSKRLPWLAEPVAIAARNTPVFSVAFPSLNDVSIFHSGSIARVPVVIERSAEAIGPIRLSLVTGQRMPKKIIKQDNQDKEVDAVEQALRLESSVTIPAEASSGEIMIMVPATLPGQSWSLALVAELLSADGQQVIGSAASPIVSVQTAVGLSLALSSPSELPLMPGAAEPVRIEGTINRENGLVGPVVVTLEGLPDMLIAPEVELADDQSSFVLELQYPAETALERWNDVHVVARSWSPSDDIQAESLRTKLTFKAP